MVRSDLYEPPFDEDRLDMLDDYGFAPSLVKFIIIGPDKSEMVDEILAKCQFAQVDSFRLGGGEKAWIGYE